MLWHEVDFSLIYKKTAKNGRVSLYYGPDMKPLRFQIPAGTCTYGVGSFSAINVDFVEHQTFINWYADFEEAIGAPQPFNSNMKNESLRLKMDETTLVFDWNNKMEQPAEIREGMFSNSEVVCIVDVSSIYFFNDVYGLTCRLYQVKHRQKSATGHQVIDELKKFAFQF